MSDEEQNVRDIVRAYERQRKQRYRQRVRDNEDYIDRYNIKYKKDSPLSGTSGSTEAFDRFWLAYPKRKGTNPKHPARVKFFRAVKSGTDPEAMIAAAKAYASDLARERKEQTEYVCMAVTWLNQRRWEDYEQQETNVYNAEEFLRKKKEWEERRLAEKRARGIKV